MSVSFPEHPFWDFSLSVYSTEGVPAACLVLQDHHQVDVNVILFCCWLGASGRGARRSLISIFGWTLLR